ncbi:MAG: cupin domain-containing protein [Patescibacteria group bacterium]
MAQIQPSKKKNEVIIKQFDRLSQIIEFFPTRNLKANYLNLDEKKSFGAHRTDDREEVVGVLQGIAYAVVNSEVFKLTKGELIYIPKNKLVNVYNRNKIVLRLIYIISKLNT